MLFRCSANTRFCSVFTAEGLIHYRRRLSPAPVRLPLRVTSYSRRITSVSNRDAVMDGCVSISSDTTMSFFPPLLLCVTKSLSSYIFVESSHFPWCIPPTLFLSVQLSLHTHTRARTHTHTHSIKPQWLLISPSCSTESTEMDWPSFLSPHSPVAVEAALPVSQRWSAGYSLNLWLLHNL